MSPIDYQKYTGYSLDILTKREREVMELLISGVSNEEASRIMGITKSNVWSTSCRARKRLDGKKQPARKKICKEKKPARIKKNRESLCCICGKEFDTPRYRKLTCSKKCRYKLMARNGKINISNKTDEEMADIKRRISVGMSKIHWHIVSPEGTHYEFFNLMEWVKGHVDLFGKTDSKKDVDTIAQSFYTIRRNMIKNGGGSKQCYGGWKVLIGQDGIIEAERTRIESGNGKCVICGKPTGRNKYCCSSRCYSEFRQNYKICPVCGKRFKCPPSSMKVTCSPECSKKHRESFEYPTETIRTALEVGKTHPLTGPYETHHSAMQWKIQDPQGNEYEFRNLDLWAREHESILPSDAIHFACGIRDIKRTLQGRKKRGSCQYKGWHLIEWSE